jgi:hypothetical protein
VADRQARGAAGEAAVGEQRADLAQALRLQVRGRVEHFLHAGAALRAFVDHDHDVAGDDLVGEDGFSTASSCDSQTRARPVNFRIDSSTPAVLTMQPFSRDVAVEHGQAAILE